MRLVVLVKHKGVEPRTCSAWTTEHKRKQLRSVQAHRQLAAPPPSKNRSKHKTEWLQRAGNKGLCFKHAPEGSKAAKFNSAETEAGCIENERGASLW